jgi:Peptidase family S41/PDZ domain
MRGPSISRGNFNRWQLILDQMKNFVTAFSPKRGPMKLLALITAVFLIYSLSAQAQTSASTLNDFTTTLQQVSQIYKSNYALADYKKQMFAWDNDAVTQDLLTRAQNHPNLTVLEAQQMIQEFFNSTRDYHAQAYFAKQPYISVPVGMHSAHGRVFISYVNPKYVGPIKLGDEVILYQNDRVIVKIYELATKNYPNFSGTDLRDATRRLTERYGILMDPIPASPKLTLNLLRPDGTSYNETLVWSGHPLTQTSQTPAWSTRATVTSRIPTNLQGEMLDNPWGYSSRKSYFPRPDLVIWEAADSDKFYAWIGELPSSSPLVKSQRVGLIRIPTFSLAKQIDYADSIKAFKVLVDKMNAETDFLVIDIQGNRGGMLDYAEALSSFFFDSPKEAYKFQYKLSPGLVQNAQMTLNELNGIKTQDDAIAFFGADHYFGYPLDLDFVTDLKNMYQGLVDDFQLASMAQPRYYNASQVKPYPGATPYMKPLFIATDAWTVSCGDWFAAFMKDHKRATTIGTRTAGGGAFTGGQVKTTTNSMQLQGITAPVALMYRLDGSKIENLGVTPDYTLEPGPNDLIDGQYKNYKRKLYKIMSKANGH